MSSDSPSIHNIQGSIETNLSPEEVDADLARFQRFANSLTPREGSAISGASGNGPAELLKAILTLPKEKLFEALSLLKPKKLSEMGLKVQAPHTPPVDRSKNNGKNF